MRDIGGPDWGSVQEARFGIKARLHCAPRALAPPVPVDRAGDRYFGNPPKTRFTIAPRGRFVAASIPLMMYTCSAEILLGYRCAND